jgi:hypothetical protein
MSARFFPAKATPVTKSDTDYITDNVRTVSNETPIVTTSVDLDTDTITKVGHGLNNGDSVTIPIPGTTDLQSVDPYYVINADADTFQLSISIGGAAVDIGGEDTTAPTVKCVSRLTAARVSGCLFIGGAGNVAVLPTDHPDTNTATEAKNGAIIFKAVAAGTILNIDVKKLFSTGTTATDVKCIYE